ncbi:PAS domain-containing protein [Paludibacterium paludis]|uniref:Sensory/regulatory protein RpfC n=1 Tax=Paludibacterium paludis TaxID=1225769 RepID=A0A918P0J7_9NEIS|nr:PAS domain-containing protein [Paludibacterium paludis]GGY11259.1 hypothetical protein GCM10011289_12720 [Paludibacterium paludis]
MSHHRTRPTERLGNSAIACGLVYFLLAGLGIMLSRQQGNIATLWLANAGLAGWLACAPPGRWPSLLLAAGSSNITAGMAYGDPLALAVSMTLANLAESSTAALLLRSGRQWPSFDRNPAGLLQLMLSGCLLPALLGATLGAAFIALHGYASFSAIWPSWFAGATIGLASFLPIMLLLLRQDIDRTVSRMLSLPSLAATSGAVLLSMLVFRHLPFPFIYLVIALSFAAIWLTIEATALVVLAGAVTTCVTVSLGWFVLPPIRHRWEIILIYLPILLSVVSPLLLAASTGQSRFREEARQLVERRFSNAMRFAATGFALAHGNGQLYEVNQTLCRMLGYSREELLALPAHRLTHPEDLAVSLGMFERLQNGEIDDYQLEKRYLHKSGAEVWVQVRVSRLESENGQDLIIQIDDIGERKAQENQIIALSERLTLATRAVGMGVWDWNMQSGDLIWDSRMFSLYFFPPSEQTVVNYGMWRTRVHPEDIADAEAQLQATLDRDEDFNTEFRILGPDGAVRYIAATALLIRDSERRPMRMVGVNRDTTEARLAQLGLEKARDAAEEASRAKSAFVANMSHEIRTPMNAVLGMTQLLADTPLTPDQRKYLDMISAAGRALLGIINDILDFSRIEADRLEIVRETFLLSHVIDALATMMTVGVGDKPVEVSIGLSPGIPRALVGDGLRLQQILISLCGNAIKFTERGHVSLRIRQHNRRGELIWLAFDVIDTGIGMSAEQLQRGFSAFTQADASVTRRFGGSGLGLAIVKRLTSAMGGTLDVSSELGKGSTFTVTLPFHASADSVTPAHSSRTQALTLMVLSDSDIVLTDLALSVGALGWRAMTDTSLAPLGELTGSAGAMPDALLIDGRFVTAKHLSAIETLRRSPRFREGLILLMVRAFERESPDILAAKPLTDAILVKPVTASALHDAITTGLASRTRPEPAARLPEPGPAQALQGRVLLVEDNTFNQTLAESLLTREGIGVAIAANGAEALDILRATPGEFDLILMDVQMPVMDGFTATRRIRGELGLSVPIIAMSAGVLESERNECLAAGMDDFVAKPIDIRQLLDTLATYLGKKDPATSGPSPAPSGDPAPLRLSILHDKARQDPHFGATLRDSIQLLVERGDTPVSLARQALAQGQFDDAARLMHALRGELGSLGAERLARTTLEAEHALRAGDAVPAAEHLDRVGDDLAQALDALRRWSDGLERPPAGQTMNREQIEEWRRLLRQNNMAALTRYQALRNALEHRLPPGQAARLNQAMSRLDFANALAVLDENILPETGSE